MNHPCTLWAAESNQNYFWLAEHAYALCNIYRNRYDKTHKSTNLIFNMVFQCPDLPKRGLTRFAQAMPDKYKDYNDPVNGYRNYYVGEKSRFAKWTCNPEPEWYTTMIKENEHERSENFAVN